MTQHNALAEAVRKHWDAHYAGVPPMGHFVRQACHERWIRVHSLPNAKRYPESDAEKAEVLRRYSTAAHLMLGNDSPVFMLLAGMSSPERDASLGVLGFQAAAGWVEAFSHDKDLADELGAFVFYVAESIWRPDDFEKLLLRIAADDLDPILFLNPATGAVFAPYDGGADLIFPSPTARDEASSGFSEWLSGRDDGM